jgi:hypothetical protein
MGYIKAKTKRRIKHLLTKKKLVSRRTSKHILRGASVIIATISMGSLAYAITINKPVVTVSVRSNVDGRLIAAPTTPTPTPEPIGGNVGRASWYALGLPQPDTITCASRVYPRGSYVEVTNLRNNKIVVCRVNDYGPEAWTGRIIDLSRGSFSQVDNLGTGTIPVRLRPVSSPTGLNLPLSTNLADLVGYNLCHKQYSAGFCDAHRQ